MLIVVISILLSLLVRRIGNYNTDGGVLLFHYPFRVLWENLRKDSIFIFRIFVNLKGVCQADTVKWSIFVRLS